MKSVNTTLKIARKEISDALHNKLFLITLGLLLLLAIVSITLAALQVRATMAEYNNSIEFLKSMGKTELPPKPSLNPLAASKGFVNYRGLRLPCLSKQAELGRKYSNIFSRSGYRYHNIVFSWPLFRQCLFPKARFKDPYGT